MKFENYTDVFYKIDNEGLEYFIENYASADSMPDKTGEELFRIAEEALSNFSNYVEEKMELEDITEDFEDEDFE